MENRLNEEDFIKWRQDAQKYPLGHTEGTFHTNAYMNYYNEGIFSNLFQLLDLKSVKNFLEKIRKAKV